MRRLHQGLALALALAAACRPASEAKGSPGAAVTPAAEIPGEWSGLGLPRKGLLRVAPETDAHGFYAEYAGEDRAALMSEVARGLWGAGYAQACSALGGEVVGFAKGGRRLATKVDGRGGLALSVFDAQGKEPRLHALCFERYAAGPSAEPSRSR